MKKIDTAPGAIDALKSAKKIHNPPCFITLTEYQMNFWGAIMRSKAYDSWTEFDLIQAANLAIEQATIQELNEEISKEGATVIKDGTNTTIPNPKFDAKIKATDLTIRLSRIIHVHSEATGGRAKDGRGKNTGERKARESIGKGSPLLAGVKAVNE